MTDLPKTPEQAVQRLNDLRRGILEYLRDEEAEQGFAGSAALIAAAQLAVHDGMRQAQFARAAVQFYTQARADLAKVGAGFKPATPAKGKRRGHLKLS